MDGEETFGAAVETESPVETAETADFEVETPAEGAETVETEPESAESTPEQPEKTALPSNVARLLRQLGESDPENAPTAKELSNTYFSHRAYKELFPDIAEARTLKTTFDTIGGPEGLLELQSVAENFENLDKMLDEGDPRLVDDILAKSPEGFSKIVPHALQALQRTNPEAYRSIIAPELASGVVGSGVGDYLALALESLKAGDTDIAARRIGNALAWYQSVEKQLQESRSAAPASAAPASGRESDLNRREYEMNKNFVQRDMNSYALSQIDSALRPLLKGHSLGKEAVADLNEGMLREVGKALLSDKTFQQQMDAFVSKGQNDKAFALAKAHIDRVRTEAVKAVWSRRYGSLKPSTQTAVSAQRRTAATQGRQSSGGTIQVPKMPPLDAIDRQRTTQDMIFAHRAVLKDGRVVTWPR